MNKEKILCFLTFYNQSNTIIKMQEDRLLTEEEFNTISHIVDIKTHFTIINEIYHAQSNKKYSPIPELLTYFPNNTEHADTRNQVFEVAGEHIELPILLMSRYFSYFEVLSKETWKKEVIKITDLSLDDMKVMKMFTTQFVDYEDCKTAFDYFGAKNIAYFGVKFSNDYFDEDLWQILDDLLVDSYLYPMLSEFACRGYFRAVFYVVCSYFLTYQTIIDSSDGYSRFDFLAEQTYKLVITTDDIDLHLLSLSLQLKYCEESSITELSPIWIGRAIEMFSGYIETYMESTAVDKWNQLFDWFSTSIDYNAECGGLFPTYYLPLINGLYTKLMKKYDISIMIMYLQFLRISIDFEYDRYRFDSARWIISSPCKLTKDQERRFVDFAELLLLQHQDQLINILDSITNVEENSYLVYLSSLVRAAKRRNQVLEEVVKRIE